MAAVVQLAEPEAEPAADTATEPAAEPEPEKPKEPKKPGAFKRFFKKVSDALEGLVEEK